MSMRTILVIVLALIFGGSAAVGVNMLRSQGSSSQKTTVVLAAEEIPRGSSVSAAQLKTVEYPPELVPPGAITKVEDAVDRAPLFSLTKDEVVLEGKLAPKSAGYGLAPLVPEGMRAFTIHTPHVASTMAGFILPGNKVDVLLTMNGEGPSNLTGGASTTTLLQNVKILAVDKHLDAAADNKSNPQQLQSVTLVVTPDQAAKLDLGQNRGTLHLSLRHPNDNKAAETRPATLAQLQGYQEKPWTDQAKEVISAIGQLMEKKDKETKEEKATRQAKTIQPRVPLEIRTLRGRATGVVQLEPVDWPEEDK